MPSLPGWHIVTSLQTLSLSLQHPSQWQIITAAHHPHTPPRAPLVQQVSFIQSHYLLLLVSHSTEPIQPDRFENPELRQRKVQTGTHKQTPSTYVINTSSIMQEKTPSTSLSLRQPDTARRHSPSRNRTPLQGSLTLSSRLQRP